MPHCNKAFKRIPTLAACALLCAAPMLHAAPVSVGVASASISAGSGYGIDAAENGSHGSLLDVRFATLFSSQDFSLASVGDSHSFNLATVTFNEPNTGSGANRGIRIGELDNLELTANFGFTDPVITIASLVASVTATLGVIDDEDVDYSIAWAPVEADFGLAGKVRISVNPLSFSDTGSQTARATIELLAAAPELRVAAVPEPTSLALVGAALAGAGFARRKRLA